MRKEQEARRVVYATQTAGMPSHQIRQKKNPEKEDG
jgi:hypothetical protein